MYNVIVGLGDVRFVYTLSKCVCVCVCVKYMYIVIILVHVDEILFGALPAEMTGHDPGSMVIWNFQYGPNYSGPG